MIIEKGTWTPTLEELEPKPNVYTNFTISIAYNFYFLV